MNRTIILEKSDWAEVPEGSNLPVEIFDAVRRTKLRLEGSIEQRIDLDTSGMEVEEAKNLVIFLNILLDIHEDLKSAGKRIPKEVSNRV